ncbi:MAG: preprotein translocase subunit SecG [Verrucomicrobiota bacterium]|jgi:preprotein translocase subunit SecG|nr:preprotein translocase subunit SecG [Verrucomicrobiota bacterium]
MLSLIIGICTIVMVINSLFLVLLILVQLPKKEAGAGLAFGAGAAETVFGAGAGTPLSKITSYAAGLFLVLALALGSLNAVQSKRSSNLLEEEISSQTVAPVAAPSATDGASTTEPAVAAEVESEGVFEDPAVAAEEVPALTVPTPGVENEEPLKPEATVPATEPNPNN